MVILTMSLYKTANPTVLSSGGSKRKLKSEVHLIYLKLKKFSTPDILAMIRLAAKQIKRLRFTGQFSVLNVHYRGEANESRNHSFVI